MRIISLFALTAWAVLSAYPAIAAEKQMLLVRTLESAEEIWSFFSAFKDD